MKTLEDTTPDRIGAEREFSAQLGVSVAFDYSAIETETEEQRIADDLIERLRAAGMTPPLALKVAAIMTTDRTAAAAVEDSTVVEVIKCMLERVLKASNPWREADCLRMAFGFRETNAESMRQKADLYGVTVEAVSKDVANLRRIFAVGINSFNKSAAAAAGYAKTNRTRIKT